MVKKWQCIAIILSFSCLNFFCSTREVICCKENTEFHSYLQDQKAGLKDSVVDIQYFSENFQKTGMYFNTGFHFYKKGSKSYISYLNAFKDSLVFINVFEKEIQKIPINTFIDKNQKYTLRIIGDTIHLINTGTYKYKQLIIDTNLRLKIIREYDLNYAFSSKKIFLNTNLVIDKKIIYQSPYLYLTFGNFTTRNNADSKIMMKIDVEKKKEVKILKYPYQYKSCDMQNFYSIVEDVSDSIFALTFQKMNFLALINKKEGKAIKMTENFFNSQFMCYDQKQEENLAYTSKFFDSDESNDNLIYSNNTFYLIKQLRRENKSAVRKIAILVFDSKLNYKTAVFGNKLLARLSLPYHSGIAVLNDSLNRIHYYDFSKK